jgi:hypothetical protein
MAPAGRTISGQPKSMPRTLESNCQLLISGVDWEQAPGTSRPAAGAQGSPKGAKAMFLIVLVIVVIIFAALMLRRHYH